MGNRADTNVAVLVGRLTRDCELKSLPSGTSVASFSLAFSTRGKEESVSNYIDCKLRGKLAETMKPYLTKGTQIGVQGTLVQESWETGGEKKSRIVIYVNNIQLLGGKSDSTAPSKDAFAELENAVDGNIPF